MPSVLILTLSSGEVKGASRYRGVTPGCHQGAWRLKLTYNNVVIRINGFEDEQEAALAWDTAMWYLRGTAMFVTAEGKPRDDAPVLPAAHLAKIKACLAKAGVPLAPNHRTQMTYKHGEDQVASLPVGFTEPAIPMAEGRARRGYSDGAYLQARAHGNSNRFQDSWLTGDRPLWLTNQHQPASRAQPAPRTLGDMSLASCELAVETSSATDLCDDDDDDDWSLASSSDDDEYLPEHASSQTECPDLIQADALTGSPGHRPLVRLLEGGGSNMAAWQASGLSWM
ncbi:hypothetical protein HaLaN_19799 [Haematococcus lacustris]|uniref:AP2/ERF domain-containing protein n=1 Tax=Haematococcus lacustris TaxID=44745 RepID=A0A699ZHZ9_HAELA|nr:hypothetical protein HaLaN_19799 [Haematococcus lacustris]